MIARDYNTMVEYRVSGKEQADLLRQVARQNGLGNTVVVHVKEPK